ncbi:MAG: hypothetical protein ACYDHN_03575 [Solirubrobacteraceae bacterium]
MRLLRVIANQAAVRRRAILTAAGVGVLLFVLTGTVASADVYGNIAPAPQLPAGGLVGRYPFANYQLDQYFPGISVGVFSGVDVSGVPPLIAYFLAQVIWLVTAFLANTVITLFSFAFSLDLLNGNGSPGSGALAPVSTAIHNLYTSTFGAPWLVVAILAAGLWAMWKALVQRRYTETAGSLAVSLLYCVLAIGIVTQPQRTIAPASKLSNELSTALLSLTSTGSVSGTQQAKSAASNQLFELLVLNPWTVLEFGGIEHCVNSSGDSVPVRPLSADPASDARLASQLETGTEVRGEGKTCINDRNKYAPHFLAYPYQSSRRNAEHTALEHADTGDLPASDAARRDGSYRLTAADKPAVEAMGKGGQYQRLLLSVVILAGETGAFLLLGALSLGVILAQIMLLVLLGFAPAALLIAVFPGRGHDFFRGWIGKLAGFLSRKVIYSLILAVILAVSNALDDATSNLGWLMAFALQAAFLWAIFLQRNRIAADLLNATAGPGAARDGASRLQSFYYATRLARMAGLHRHTPPVANTWGRPTSEGAPPPPAPTAAPPPPRPTPTPAPALPVDEPIALPPSRPQLLLGAGETPTEESSS